MPDSRRCVHALTTLVLLLLVLSKTSNAQNIFHVPGDQPSIQQAIFAANNGDTIVVAPGNYFEQINFFGKAVTLVSSDGPSATVLNGFNSFTVVNLVNGEGNGAILRGFTINSSNGAGIMVSGSSPIIENNIIMNGTGCSGGVGITLNFSGAIVRNNVITANQDFCGGSGAGILVQGSNVNSVQLLNNTITFNQTFGNGSGIALVDAGTPIVSANTIRNNTASQGLGGGFYMTGNTTPVLSDNLIAGNQASVGGGVYSLVSNATIINNTVVNNSIVGQPSGDAPQVFVDGANFGVQFFNNILIDRTGKGAVFCGNSNFSVPSFTNNDVLSTDPGQPGQSPVLGYTGSCQDATGTNGNIQQDALFIAESFGSPDNGDYHLQAASPAIDTGFSAAPNLPQLDLDGNPRIAAGSEISCNPVVDMGAYELLAVTTGTAVLSPTSLSFGSGQIGLPPNTQTLFLQATQGCVQVHSIQTTGDYQTSSNCSAMFAGGSCSIQVAFTPKTAGIRTGTVTVDIGPAAPSQSATLVGEGVNSGAVSPTSLNFGTWPIQSGSSFQVIQVQTAPGVVMQVNSISITGDFAQFNSCSSQFGQLPTGIACFVNVQFVPTAGGPRTGTLTINTSQGVFAVPLSGNGAAPVPVLTPATVAFASQTVGSTSSAQTVTLSNNGTADLFINGFNTSADFQVAPLSCAGFLPSGANCTLAVTFAPTIIGARTGVLEVDTNGGPATAALSGTATPPIATLAPQMLAFAPQPLLTTGDAQTVTVTNISGAPLNLISISAVDNFFATSNCPATLVINGSCTISVAYAPQSATPDSGVLTVRTNLGPVTALLSVTHRTINVPTVDAPSIMQAVSIAQDGDIVLVAPGTYFEQVNFLGKAITIASAGGPGATVIDGSGFQTPVFAFNFEGPRSVLRGFTITHGNNGGVVISNASPTIEGNIITGNNGCNGGGISVFSSSAVIRNNIISNNSDSPFCFNSAGGGIQVNGFNQNVPIQITGNLITGNQISSFQNGGGGIAVLSGLATISGNTIQNNITNGNGGGIFVIQGAEVDVIQNLITGNSANIGGGMYHSINFSPSQVLNNTVAGNSAFSASAAFFDGADAGVSVMNNLLIDSTGIGAVACGFSGQTPSFSFNDVFSAGQPNLAYGMACPDMTGFSGNIKQDPQFVDPNGDYHLQAASPAIDSGNAFVGSPFGPAVPQTDLDGKGRIGPGNANTCTGVIDMGAYEFTLIGSGVVSPLPPTLDFGAAVVNQFGLTFNLPVSVQGCVQLASVKSPPDFQLNNFCGNAINAAGCSIQITFDPLTNGPRDGALTLDFGSSSPSQTVTLTGQGVGSTLFSSPSSLDFGTQTLQTSSAPQSVSIFSFVQNTNVVINTIWVTGDFSQTNNCTPPFGPFTGPFCTINVTFTPTAIGPRSGSLIISSNQGTLAIPLSGSASGGTVTGIIPTSLIFADQAVNTASAAQLITLTNNGTTLLQPQQVSVNDPDFSANSGTCDLGLNPGQSCTYSVFFNPLSPGPKSALLAIVTDAGNFTASLSGTGLGAIVSVSPDSLTFGAQVLQTTSVAQTVTLSNTGNQSLTVGSFSINGDFSLSSTNCLQSLSAGASCSINVTFTPSSLGARSGVLASAGTFDILVSGTGASATASVSPQSLALGSQLTNHTSSAQTVTLTAGINPLQISSISVSGDFAQTNNCPASLAPATTCSIQVTFTPLSSGAETGALTITSNEGSLTASLSGSGITRVANAIYVPGDQPTIQAGINAASSGQSVLVFPGTYAEHINFNGKAITVASTDGPALTTIDGSLTGTVVTFSTGEGANSILNGFTLTRGTVSFNGSGIAITSSSPIIDSNVITANQGCGGIGIGIQNGSPIIRNNTISNNNQTTCSGGNGGGIEVLGGSPQILNNVISGNQLILGGSGGGIDLNGASATIVGNTIRDNSVFNDGGGISVVNNSPANIIENLITGNTNLSGNGGGMFLGVPSGDRGPFVVSNTVAGNTGSAIFIQGFYSATKIVNNILVGNLGSVALQCSALFSNAPPLLGFNDAFSTGAAGYGGNCAPLAGASGNISLNPQFVNAANNNYHLQASSPAIDAGNNSDPNLPQLDLDGNPRIAFGNASTCVNTVDLGVYEFRLTTSLAATLSPATLDFGVQPVGNSSSAQSFTITATQGCVSVSAISATGDFSQTNNCSSVLTTGASCSAQVTFTPAVSGLRSGTLNVPTGNTILTSSLSGTGVAPAPVFTPAAVNFGSQRVATTASQNLTLANNGTAPLNISAITLSGSAEFNQTNNCPASLATGASCTVSVTFRPLSRGSKAATLSFTSSQPFTASAALSGTGIAPVAGLTPSLTFTPQIVQTTTIQAATLTNSGDAPLTIASVGITGDFTQTNNCGSLLAAGASCTLQVSFTPTVSGARTGSLVVNDDDPAAAQQTSSLSGAGLDYAISASPASVNVAAGTTAVYTATVSALGGTYSNSVGLSCSGLPISAFCSFSPAAVVPGTTSASATLVITSSSGQHGVKKTPAGTYTITISGVSGSLRRSTVVKLVVN